MLGYGQGLETLPEAPERPRNETTRHDTLPECMERGRAGDAAGGHAGSAFILCKMTMKNRKIVKNYWVIPF